MYSATYTPSYSSRHDADRRFPGPLRIPQEPRYVASPSPSPYSSEGSSPSYRSPSPPPSWPEKLPPIRHLAPSPRDNLPHLSSIRYSHDPSYPKSSSAAYRRPTYYPEGPALTTLHSHDSDPYSHSHHTAGTPSSKRTCSDVYGEQPQRVKFGVRKGNRFYCTYVSPVTGERCAAWDQGWTVYATLNRHAESDHAHEEIALIERGRLTYAEAQIVTSREKHERIEENLASTGRCPDCGTVFSSNRKDSLTRHKQTNACEKAQKRGRPPTKFPKKPKGQGFHIMEVDSGDDAY